MPIKVSYTNPANGNVIAEVELGASGALINAIADAEIAERALGGETINRPTALRRLARAWVRDMRQKANNDLTRQAVVAAMATVTHYQNGDDDAPDA